VNFIGSPKQSPPSQQYQHHTDPHAQAKSVIQSRGTLSSWARVATAHPQWLHTLARSSISSAQKRHFFMTGLDREEPESWALYRRGRLRFAGRPRQRLQTGESECLASIHAATWVWSVSHSRGARFARRGW